MKKLISKSRFFSFFIQKMGLEDLPFAIYFILTIVGFVIYFNLLSNTPYIEAPDYAFYNFEILLTLNPSFPKFQQNGIFNESELNDFQLRDDFHRPNPFNKGGLCLAVISANRPYYLLRTLKLLLYYIQKYEPHLHFDLVWVDTATANFSSLLKFFEEKYHFDKILRLPKSSRSRQLHGIPETYEHVFHLCKKNEFIIPFEEDFELIPTPQIGFIQTTLDILNKAPHELMGLQMRGDSRYDKRLPILNMTINVKGVDYLVKYQKGLDYQFTNGACIYRMSNVMELVKFGKHNPYYEITMSDSARKMGMFYGFVDFDTNCTLPKGSCNRLFDHIGYKSARTKSKGFILPARDENIYQ